MTRQANLKYESSTFFSWLSKNTTPERLSALKLSYSLSTAITEWCDLGHSHKSCVFLVSQLGIEIHRNPLLQMHQRIQTLSVSILSWFWRMKPAERTEEWCNMSVLNHNKHGSPGTLLNTNRFYPWLTSCALYSLLVSQQSWLCCIGWTLRRDEALASNMGQVGLWNGR